MKTILEAIQQIKEDAKEKFDTTIEAHINLSLDVRKGQNIRYSLTLPNGTGKTKKVAVIASTSIKGADLQIDPEDINKIVSGKLQPKKDFDIIVCEPRYMANLAKAARVLGPAGLMPSPKTGTVTDNVEEAVTNIKKGQVQVKTEKDVALVHTIIGKASFKDEQLMENFIALYNSLKQNKPQKAKPDWIKNVYLCSSMGKSIQVDLSAL